MDIQVRYDNKEKQTMTSRKIRPATVKKYIGQVYGKLTVERVYLDQDNQAIKCHCVCRCGGEKEVFLSNLVSGRTTSCGCNYDANSHRHLDITGERFGRLVALEPTKQRISGSVVWKCQCDCGNTCLKSVNALKRGFAWHCGCVNKKVRHRKGEE